MAILTNLRSQLGRSFGDTLIWMFGFVEGRPAFLRPAFYGAFFIWTLILFRGGLIVLPIALPILFFTDRQLFGPLLLTFLVLAPAGGFLGGLLYSAVSPIANRLVLGSTIAQAPSPRPWRHSRVPSSISTRTPRSRGFCTSSPRTPAPRVKHSRPLGSQFVASRRCSCSTHPTALGSRLRSSDASPTPV